MTVSRSRPVWGTTSNWSEFRHTPTDRQKKMASKMHGLFTNKKWQLSQLVSGKLSEIINVFHGTNESL